MLIKILIIFIVLYLMAIYPDTSRKAKMKPYEQKFIAHRGLYDNVTYPENSLSAFQRAVEHDYGIELDLQLTADDQLVVFHDVSLLRMTGIDRKLTDCTYEELLGYPLLNSDERIPLFAEVLKVLRPDTPLIIEIKPEGRYIETTQKTVEMMRNYEGLYNMESFNPSVVRYLRMNEPQIVRGQLSYNYLKNKDSDLPWHIKFILTNLLTNFYNRPDYIAYDCKHCDNISFQLVSRLCKAEGVAWTVQSQEEYEKIKHLYGYFIFYSFIPKDRYPN